MNFLKHLRIRTVAWGFIIALTIAGGLMATTSIITLEKVSLIETTWNIFEQGRSEKDRALNALRQSLGYGGMIHNFKNYVLRKDPTRVGIINAYLGGAQAALARYEIQDTTEGERIALDNIKQTLDAYSKATDLAQKMVREGKSTAEIDQLIRVDDSAALSAMDTLDKSFSQTIEEHTETLTKPQILSRLRRALGYGGMIHHFKNFVLRHDHALIGKPDDRSATIQKNLPHDDALIKKLNDKFIAAKENLLLYEALELNPTEEQALADIQQIIAAYEATAITVETLAEEGLAPFEIDKRVRIDDEPALTGLTTLIREISSQSDIEAGRVDTALQTVARTTEITVWLTSALILFLIAVSLWAFRSRIINPITRMTGVMSRLASGDLKVSVHATDQKNEIGEMARAIEVFKTNAIERARAEDSLKEQEERHRLILDNAADGIITADDRGIIQTFNPAAEKLFEYSTAEIIGQSLDVLMPEAIRHPHTDYISRYLETGESRVVGNRIELEGLKKDGGTFPLELAVSEMIVGGNKIFTGIISDITQRKEADRMKNEFISTVSHELRTPLTSIKGSLGLIRSGHAGDLPDALKGMLDIAYNNCDRLVRLINDILDIEKISAGKMDFQMKPLALAPLLTQAIEANKAYGEERRVTFVLTDIAQDATVLGDPDRLMQVLANLLSNAAKFSPENDEVEISLHREGTGFRISVHDHGRGIAAEFQSRIFGKFQQGDSSDSREKGGTGLGLNIAKSIIELHNGTIGFDSRPGGGTTFYFSLPELAATAPLATKLPAAVTKKKSRILICEDEPDIANLIQLMLQQEGYETDIAYSAASARELLGKNDYAAITLDLGLPDEDGVILIRELRNNPATHNLPIIVVSAKAKKGKVELNGDAVGIIDWMEKPVDHKRLIDDIRLAMKAAPSERPRILHIEDDTDILRVVTAVIGAMADVTTATTFEEGRQRLKDERFDLIILDLKLPDGEGEDLLPYLKKTDNKETPVIVFSVKEIS
ncbi:MAG: response regulator, partial [Rhodospirillaceae bacterium]|nr:response regulator [Rhodospirillaceae bacterium]